MVDPRRDQSLDFQQMPTGRSVHLPSLRMVAMSACCRPVSLARLPIVALALAITATGVLAQGRAARRLRKLAPGVVTEIPAKIEEEETFSGPRPMNELIELGGARLDWTPHTLAKSETLLYMAQNAIFRRQIWGLELGFKPLRMLPLDI